MPWLGEVDGFALERKEEFVGRGGYEGVLDLVMSSYPADWDAARSVELVERERSM